MQSLPSPASSPSLDSSDSTTTQPSRKRQRSRSMQSDASSSSLKRSVAEASGSPEHSVRTPASDQMSSLTLGDLNQDIDSYMADQGEADIPPFISNTPPDTATTQSMLPSEKITYVEEGKGKKMEVGETWYLISRDWWKRWKKACTGQVDKEGPVSEKDLGPVDNARLLDSYGNLISSLAEGVDVEYVPIEVWNSFNSWYGAAHHPLPRHVIGRGAAKQASLELRPPRLKVFRLSQDSPENLMVGPPHPWIEISSAESMETLCKKVAKAVQINRNIHTPFRVWKPETNLDEWRALEFPNRQLDEFSGKIIEESSRTLEEEGIETEDIFIVEFKTLDGWIVDFSKTQKKSGTIEGPPPLFNSKDSFFHRLGSSSSASATVKSSTDFFSGFGKSSSLSLTNNKSYMKTLEPGVLGLGNMGNTCFMNSALQCLAHTKELSDYFLSGVFKDELNPDNPLGMHGAIAEAFGSLLERIWATSGPSTSYSPREFKQQLQRFAPQFSGYQQHDSQELVAFLLDGLHEDLNRVIKKPYVEKPDWDGGGDVELVKLALKSWEGYMMRNDSVIVDLFQGQYQSTLVCPECAKVSITFDPFMYLTLPLPVQKKWKHEIYYVPWDMEQQHVKVPIEINRDASFKDLRVLLGRWMNAIPDNLLTMEIFQNRFYKNLDDTISCSDMSDTDIIVCFELPCNARQNRMSKRHPDDPFVVPMFLCDAKAPASRTGFGGMTRNSPSLFGYPTVVVITRQQATDVNAIYDAVVARLQRWTAHARYLYDWEVGAGSADEVPIQLNGFPPIDSITEITEDGVVTIQTPSEEGDIVDETGMVVDEDSGPIIIDTAPRPIRAKRDVFALRLQVNHRDYGTTYSYYNTNTRWESWERRIDDTGEDKAVLREGDAFFCEFDENMKAYFFGETRTYEHARWDEWEEFIHPDYAEAKKVNSQKRQRGISLQDCLEEFVKEEKLGEDDLWYCPRCKKHQQATKKFDLWKVPDILVVHLKRFSNSRTLRDKIDTLIDFPIDGLDLGEKVGERSVAKRLLEQGVDMEELKQVNLDEPLVYDLFGVDEHMGGLGGGHYRAYASNHLTGKWHHFDDAYVTPAVPKDAVNANAYLLFYRRRSSNLLGGKTYQKAMQAHELKPEISDGPGVKIDTQLPTPPNERSTEYRTGSGFSAYPSQSSTSDFWKPRSDGSNPGSSVPSPPADDPPDFEEAQSDLLVSDPFDHMLQSTQSYDFPDPYRKSSPTSSNEADIDVDTELDDGIWDDTRFTVGVREADESPDCWESRSNLASPSYSESSDANPFNDANVQGYDKDEADVSFSKYNSTL